MGSSERNGNKKEIVTKQAGVLLGLFENVYIVVLSR